MVEIQKYILAGVLTAVMTLTVQKMFLAPEPGVSYEVYKKRNQEIDNKILEAQEDFDKKINNIQNRDERIKTDSIIIIDSDREYRDSLRRVHNPPTRRGTELAPR